jgi:hypothetical protein
MADLEGNIRIPVVNFSKYSEKEKLKNWLSYFNLILIFLYIKVNFIARLLSAVHKLPQGTAEFLLLHSILDLSIVF